MDVRIYFESLLPAIIRGGLTHDGLCVLGDRKEKHCKEFLSPMGISPRLLSIPCTLYVYTIYIHHVMYKYRVYITNYCPIEESV